jgi:hypothetical protein
MGIRIEANLEWHVKKGLLEVVNFKLRIEIREHIGQGRKQYAPSPPSRKEF